MQKDSLKNKNQGSGCPVGKKCGGCIYTGMPYEEQLKLKHKKLVGQLGKYGEVKPVIGMQNPLFYRNKVHHVFSWEKGKVKNGIYAEGSHRVIPVKECLIEDRKSQEIIKTIEKLVVSFKIKVFDEDTGYGLLRHVLIRHGFKSGEIMVVLVVADRMFPGKNNFIKVLRKEHPEITGIEYEGAVRTAEELEMISFDSISGDDSPETETEADR